MKRQISVALAFLISLLAKNYAAAIDPTSNLTVQIVPPSVGGGPVPAMAQAAGFTTAVLDLDFSQPQWANPQNFIDCSGSSSDPQYLFYLSSYVQVGSVNGLSGVCGNISQVNDGGLALNIPFRTNYFNLVSEAGGDPSHTNLMLLSYNGSHGRQFSQGGVYVEIVQRITVNRQNTRRPPAGLYLGYNTAPQFFGGMEYDLGEYIVDGSSTIGAINWIEGTGQFAYFWDTFGNGYPAGWSTTSYHKMGILVTNNGSNSIITCPFIDDVLQHDCADIPGRVDSNMLSIWKEFVVLSTPGEPAGGLKKQTPDYDYRIKSLRVFSCPSWQNSGADGNCAAGSQASQTVSCNSPGNCPSGTATLRYWH